MEGRKVQGSLKGVRIDGIFVLLLLMIFPMED
jgi:hypothetical protein